MHVPTVELAEAQTTGRLRTVYLGIIRDIYGKWAQSSGCPAPPELPQAN
jgi:hypothetical protein